MSENATTIGTTLSHCQITEKLGGGDRNLSRQVALTVLPGEFALDAETLASFKREHPILELDESRLLSHESGLDYTHPNRTST